jgi:flavin reductase (DIM6/NTAB) family NADH-FMN oxidoreductase RutF/DNA-binding GntR family transcriptional regulator
LFSIQEHTEVTGLVDENLFRDVIGRFASGVAVITTTDGRTDYGTTASAVSSLSLEPPMLLICLNRTSETQRAVLASRCFAVNILGDDQRDLALQFAKKGSAKFDGVEIAHGRRGPPLLLRALAYLECCVAETAQGGTHTVIMGEVEHAWARDGTPLTYFRGTFGRFENAVEEAAYRELRRMVVGRALPLGEPLDFDELAADLDLRRPDIYFAVTRLRTEGLIVRKTGAGYFVNPLDLPTAEQALDARYAIEAAVAEQTVGKVAEGELEELARLVAQAERCMSGSDPVLDCFLRAIDAFHRQLVGLARNEPLLGAYEGLGIQALWTHTLRGTDWPTKAVGGNVRPLLEAYRRGDLEAVKRVLGEQNAYAKELAREVIEAAGGSI